MYLSHLCAKYKSSAIENCINIMYFGIINNHEVVGK